ncbi:MAG: metallophosphoesterase [Lentisphaeria bacterium]|nr:metallophosphoesterase [Lentisphaeria bacterium]
MMKKFLLSLGLLTITILLCAANTDQYSVLVFGDLHHDARDLRVNDPDKNKEFKRNIEAWQKYIPGMLQTAAGIANKDCAFAVQCGDITQGDEGNDEFSAASFKRVLAEMEKYLQIPFYPVRGNHDVRGIGKRKASDDILPAYLKKQNAAFPAKNKSQTCYKVYGKDLFIFFDSEGDSLNAIREILEKNTGMRHIFLVTHLPIVPCVTSANSYWITYWTKPEKRTALRKLLAENNVIVLAAHTHLTAYFKWQFPEGAITQFTSFSIAGKSNTIKEIQSGTEKDYFRKIDDILNAGNLKPREAKKQAYLQKLIPEYRNAKIRYTFYTRTAGFNILRIKGNEVYMDIHAGTSSTPNQTVQLK